MRLAIKAKRAQQSVNSASEGRRTFQVDSTGAWLCVFARRQSQAPPPPPFIVFDQKGPGAPRSNFNFILAQPVRAAGTVWRPVLGCQLCEVDEQAGARVAPVK